MATFFHTLNHFPANGQVAALRTALEAQVRARQAEGFTVGLRTVMYGTDTPLFRIVFSVESLAELEPLSGASQQSAAFTATVAALTARPPQLDLFQQVVGRPTGAAPRPVAWVRRTEFRPVTGMFGELRAALEENTRERQAGGGRTTLAMARSGSPRLLVFSAYESMAEMEELPPSTAAQNARMKGLFAEPPTTTIERVVISPV